MSSIIAKAPQLPRLDPTQRLPGEQSVADEAAQIFANPTEWIGREHPMLAGRTPQECIDAGDNQPVWDLLRNIKYIAQT